VFNWILEGLDRLLIKERFTHSELVKKQLEEYRKESDSIQLFLEDKNCIKSNSDPKQVKQLFSQYKEFCQESNYKQENKIHFKKRLIQLGYEVKRDKTGNVVYLKMKKNK